VFEALYESLRDSNHKTAGGIVEFLYLFGVTAMILVLVTGTFIIKVPYLPMVKVILGYLFLRFALFDAIYNLVSGLPLFYIGSTKVYDKIFKWFFDWTKFPKEHFLAMVKLILLFIGLTFLL